MPSRALRSAPALGAAELTGEENADEIRMGHDGQPLFLANNAGGILGGISSGQPMVWRSAVKPTSSILATRKTVHLYWRETEVSTKGRHDPCVGIRAADRRGHGAIVLAVTICAIAGRSASALAFPLPG